MLKYIFRYTSLFSTVLPEGFGVGWPETHVSCSNRLRHME
uniref:Uncharacterized protein n=1 Tax=Rhizophora mucronata TaxID=61149 RepID=A0A2P2MXX7_RHIMU